MLMKIYGAAMSAIYALGLPYLRRRYAEGFDERRGIYDPDKIKRIKHVLNGPIWVHAVSVGEVQAAVPFISEIKKLLPNVPVLLSTTTTTGAKMAENMGAKCDAHIYFPWDTPSIIARALDKIAPTVFVATESEIWPLLMTELKRRNIPSFLINGRISDRSFKRMKKISRWCPDFLAGLLSSFDAIMVKEDIDSERLRELGVPREKITVTGDCKIDAMIERKTSPPPAPPLSINGEGGENLLCSPSPFMERGPGGEVFIAGSTHPGEDEKIFEAFDAVKNKIPHSRLIIAPRHPERAPDVAALAKGNAVFYSELEKFPSLEWDILIVDKIGVLFGLYCMADAAFVGGSLVPKGGQNLMEPALFGVPICHGPFMDDFRAVADEFDAIGISRTVNSPAEIANFWIESGNFREKIKISAENWFTEHSGAAKKSASIAAKAVL